MTVTVTTTISGPYTPNGVATAFAFDFKVLSGEELTVYQGEPDNWASVNPALYSVSVATEGGTVNFAAPPAGGTGSIYIVSDPSFQQGAGFSGGEVPFTPASVNQQFDRAAVRALVLKRDVDAAVKLPLGESFTKTLATKASLANQLAGFDDDGEPTTFDLSASNLATLAGLALQIDAVADIAGDVSTIAPHVLAIGTVAGIHDDVSIVAGGIAAINSINDDLALGLGASYILRAPGAAVTAVAAAATVAGAVSDIARHDTMLDGWEDEVSLVGGNDPDQDSLGAVAPTNPRSDMIPLADEGHTATFEFDSVAAGNADIALFTVSGTNWTVLGWHSFVATASTGYALSLEMSDFTGPGGALSGEFHTSMYVWFYAAAGQATFKGTVAGRRLTGAGTGGGNGHAAVAAPSTSGTTAPYLRVTVTKTVINTVKGATDALNVRLTSAEENVGRNPGPPKLVVTDEEGNIGLELDEAGLAVVQGIADGGGIGSGGSGETSAQKAQRALARAAVVEINWLSQSLGVGADSEEGGDSAVVISGPVASGLKYNGGVRPQDTSTDPAVSMASFATLQETVFSGLGETQCSGFVRMLEQLLFDEDGLVLADTMQRFLMVAPGAGGENIGNLTTGTLWQRFKDTVTRGKAVAGDSFANPLMVLDQGQANASNFATWDSTVAGAKTNWDAHRQSVEGNSVPGVLLINQLATWAFQPGATSPGIILKQLAAGRKPNCAIATPQHQFDYSLFSGTESSHLKAHSYAHNGAYLGWWFKRWFFDGIWMPNFEPTEIVRDGKWIMARYPVEAGRKLEFDATQPAVASRGFTVDSGAGAVTIDQVGITGGGSWVGVKCATTPTDNYLLRAGFATVNGINGQPHRGMCHLRDNTGDELIFAPGDLDLPMHRWALLGEWRVGDYA